ncbi:hypothetical protein BJX63DRAFT_438506 [Aspergillus granulosus]|uniref:Uncharacterized protein n=1 Tax=Aspergillus granulosus TaxID=176169 RepID=A0ABR4GRT4_9EURO
MALQDILAGNALHGGIAPSTSGTFTDKYDADNVHDKSVLSIKDLSSLQPANSTVFAAQGGLLLDIAAQHNIVDAAGIFCIARLLSKLMDDHPNPIPHTDPRLGSRDRQNLNPLLSPPPLDPGTFRQFKWYLLHFTLRGHRLTADPVIYQPITPASINDAVIASTWQHHTHRRHTWSIWLEQQALRLLVAPATM